MKGMLLGLHHDSTEMTPFCGEWSKRRALFVVFSTEQNSRNKKDGFLMIITFDTMYAGEWTEKTKMGHDLDINVLQPIFLDQL